MQLMMRSYIMFPGLRGVVEDSALVVHNTTLLSILFGTFRRNGLPLSSTIEKSAAKLHLTERNSSVGFWILLVACTPG